jgi:hypothetical protein
MKWMLLAASIVIAAGLWLPGQAGIIYLTEIC